MAEPIVVTWAAVAAGMATIILAGGGAWAYWLSMTVIGLTGDMKLVKRNLKINGK